MLKTPSFVFACWLCLIAIVGLSRVYDMLPPQSVALTVVVGTGLLLLLSRFSGSFRGSLESISTEQLICVHAIRAPIGAAFLVMASEGLMPDLFANRAGYGDIATAILGVGAIVLGTVVASEKLKRRVYVVWNLIGFADLLLAVGTGIYLALRIPDSMVWIVRLPLLLVPTFVLPLLFSTHIIMLIRLIRPAGKP